jgi:DUF1016 N-terminal domain
MSGLSARNLKYMRVFVEAHIDPEVVQQVVAQLPWGYNVRLLESVKDPAARLWYAREAIEHGCFPKGPSHSDPHDNPLERLNPEIKRRADVCRHLSELYGRHTPRRSATA